jgi:hypothetical protein
MLFHLVIDPECGHLVAATPVLDLARDHAAHAGLAGYHTRIVPSEDMTAWPPTSWECPRCLHRLSDTTNLLFRQHVILACDAMGIDPQAAVYAYDKLRTSRPALTAGERADATLTAMEKFASRGGMHRPPVDWSPEMFTEPSDRQ